MPQDAKDLFCDLTLFISYLGEVAQYEMSNDRQAEQRMLYRDQVLLSLIAMTVMMLDMLIFKKRYYGDHLVIKTFSSRASRASPHIQWQVWIPPLTAVSHPSPTINTPHQSQTGVTTTPLDSPTLLPNLASGAPPRLENTVEEMDTTISRTSATPR